MNNNREKRTIIGLLLLGLVASIIIIFLVDETYYTYYVWLNNSSYIKNVQTSLTCYWSSANIMLYIQNSLNI